MNPCVYETQFPRWLEEAASPSAGSKLVCFRSKKRWTSAANLLTQYGTLPILFREQKDTAEGLSCRFRAELVEIHFQDQFETDANRRAWLTDKLWLQRDRYVRDGQSDEFESQEIDHFFKARTWYLIRNTTEIEAVPLHLLRKLGDDKQLARNYTRGYALCHYPVAIVKDKSKPRT